ncbi:MAG: T9SS type A sorting domain-containing protein, partial [Bacteroidales bacterium]|nr:T9SS type A sorting domain-containing protein [Bacteroidales bacterium]
ITSNTSYTSNLTTAAGCDSIVTININVVSTYQTSVNADICSGDSYTFPDGTTLNNITANVTQIDTLNSLGGCDSVVTTNVIANPHYNLSETVAVCSGSSYTFPDGTSQNNITSNFTYTSNLNSVFGCDSVITTNINVVSGYDISNNVTVCSGSSYTFPDGTTVDDITAPLTQVDTLSSMHGCDSIITTTLSVNPSYSSSMSVSVCSGDSHTFPDGTTVDNITSNIVRSDTLETVNACDSIITTYVSAIHVNVSVVQDQATLTAQETTAAYQWVDCNNNYSSISGATERVFEATSDGSYAVIVTQNQCSDTSSCYSVTGVGIYEDESFEKIRIYPNPSGGEITIEGMNPDKESVITIWNPDGDIVFSKKIRQTLFVIDLKKESRGTYLIRLINDKKEYSAKVILL